MKAKKKNSSGANKNNKSVGQEIAGKKSTKKKAVKADKPAEKSVSNEPDAKAEKKSKRKSTRSTVRKRAKAAQTTTTQTVPEQQEKPVSDLTTQSPQSPQIISPQPEEKPFQVSSKEEKTVKDVIPELEGVEIPSILFEGDTLGSTEPQWIKKYALGPESVRNHFEFEEESFELPESYGTGEMTVTARDPYWIYAAWDLTLKQIRHYNNLSAHGNMVLRVYADRAEGMPKKEIHLYPHSRDWFIKVDEPGLTYVIALGYYDKNGVFVNVAISSPVKTPQPLVLKVPVEDVVVEKQIEEPRAVGTAPEQVLTMEQAPLVEQTTTEKSLAATIPEQAGEQPILLPSPKEQAILVAMSLPFVQKGSVEFVKQKEKAAPEKQAEKQIITLPSSIEFGISSPTKQPEERKFWFNIQAEIIIYGATEPDATVEIAGEKVKLRPDGTFTLRFALPDGFYRLLASATSADGKDVRLVNLEFSRKTSCVIGKTGECPHVSPPIPKEQGGK